MNNPAEDASRSFSDEHWMLKALACAERSYKEGEVPVGAIIVQDDKVVGAGWNQPIGHCDPTAHAEIMAIRAASSHCHNYRLPNTTLYVTIEPCTMCLGAIVHARIDRVVFGALEPKSGALVSHPNVLETLPFNHRFTLTQGVCEQECSQLMQTFFQMRREQKRHQKK